VDNQIQLPRKLDRYLARCDALEDLVDEISSAMEALLQIYAIRSKAAFIGNLAKTSHERQSNGSGERCYLSSLAEEHRIERNDDGADLIVGESPKCGWQFVGAAHRCGHNGDVERGRSRFYLCDLGMFIVERIDQKPEALAAR